MSRLLVVALLAWVGNAWCAQAPEVVKYIESMPPAELMEGVGNSRLAISTDVTQAQKFFDQGVSLLHDFWEFEAYRSFRRAAELDPAAPMPHWGLFHAIEGMKNLNAKEKKAQQALCLAKIDELMGNASAREKYYLRSVKLAEQADDNKAAAAYRLELEDLLTHYPDEIEARLFIWRSLDIGFDAKGRPKKDQYYAQILLERELRQFSDHQGVLHYWIHNQESGPRPETALDAAKKLANNAPNSGHIVHMPGHIHYLMGNYHKATEQFLLSERVDQRYMDKYGVPPVYTWNYLHNMAYLIDNLAEYGRYQEAMTYSSKLAKLAATSEHKQSQMYEFLAWLATFQPARIAWRFGDFKTAARLLDEAPVLAGMDKPHHAANKAAYASYYRGMAAAQHGDTMSAQAAANRLAASLWRAQREESKAFDRLTLTIAALELEGMLASARGNHGRAIELLRQAIDKEAEFSYREPPAYPRPLQESLAQVYLARQDWAQARQTYKDAFKERAKSGYAWYGIAKTWQLEGNKMQATKSYRRFLQAWKEADQQLPRLLHANNWLDENKTLSR